MKTTELFELRKSKLRPITRETKVYVPSTHRGARQEFDYMTSKPTGKWYVMRKVPYTNDDGTVMMGKSFMDVGFRKLSKSDRGDILGTIGDWLDEMGATPADIAPARAQAVKSPEYERLIKMGFKDISSPGEIKAGTISLSGTTMKKLYRSQTSKEVPLVRRVHINGNIRTQVRDDAHHAGRGRTFHPWTVKTHPNMTGVERLVGSMRQSMQVLIDMYRKPMLQTVLNRLAPKE